MTQQSLLKDPLPVGFTKVPAKEPEEIKIIKKSHRSSGKSTGQFGKPPEKHMLVGFFDLQKFAYSRLYKEPDVVIALAEMSLGMDHLNWEISSLRFFRKAEEKTWEILGLVKYALICGIDGYRNTIVHWLSWVTDRS